MGALTLIGAPYHLGKHGVGVGAGPLDLLAGDGLPAALRDAGHDAELEWLDDPSAGHEVGGVFELNRALAAQVSAARERGRMPVIFAGNCAVCLGGIGGLAPHKPGIVWFDAHPDFHTPETTESGFLDGMGLAAATGACWTSLCASIPGFEPVAERDSVLVGIRDIDPAERERLDGGEVTAIESGTGPGSLRLADLERAVDEISGRVDGVYLHIDFDAIDPSLGAANEHAAEDGLGLDDIRSAVAAIAERTPVLAVALTGYNPGVDPDGRFQRTAVEIATTTLAAVS